MLTAKISPTNEIMFSVLCAVSLLAEYIKIYQTNSDETWW